MVIPPGPRPTRSSRRIGVGTLSGCIAFAAVVGCARPTLVEGVVTLDGQPLSNAMVQFFPLGSEGRTAAVQADSSGRYRVNLTPHPMRVVISFRKPVAQVNDGTGEVTEEVVPKRYSDMSASELSVKPLARAVTTADFALSSAK